MTISVSKEYESQELQKLNRMLELDLEWSLEECSEAWQREIELKEQAYNDHPTQEKNLK